MMDKKRNWDIKFIGLLLDELAEFSNLIACRERD